MFSYILFDLDGTLSDPKPGITKSVQYALHHLGIEEPDLDKLTPFIGPPLQDSFQEFYGMDKKQAEYAVEKYRERFSVKGLYENTLYPGMERMLGNLKAAGCHLAVSSSKPEIFVEKILEYFKIAGYFEVVTGSGLDGRRAKKEEVIRETLERLSCGGDLPYEGIIMVGDRRYDVEGARLAGLPCVGVSFGHALPGELEESGAAYLADTVEELEHILLEGGPAKK